VVEIAAAVPKTEHTYYLHQFCCKVLVHMKEWGPLHEVSAFGLEHEGGELKKQVHSLNRQEQTLMTRWNHASPAFLLPSLQEAQSDLATNRIMPGFQPSKRYIKYEYNHNLREESSLLFKRQYKVKPRHLTVLQEFMNSCYRQLPGHGWSGLTNPPCLELGDIKLSKYRKCRGYIMRSTSTARGQRFAGGSCYVTSENIREQFPNTQWGITSTERYGACVQWYVEIKCMGLFCTLARVELLQVRERGDGFWLANMLPSQPSLTFLPTKLLEIPCIVAPMPGAHTSFYFIELDINYTTYSMEYPPALSEEMQRSGRKPQ